MKTKKYKVLMWSKSSRKEKVVYKYIELKPVQNSDRLFYFLKPDNPEQVILVYYYKGIYVTDFSFKCQLDQLDNPKALHYNIEFFETWINKIPNKDNPSLLDIRLYQELRLDYHSLELRHEEYHRNDKT